jgi:hypothetical protein
MHIELEVARELVAARAAAARTILTNAGAPNYAEIEMGFSLADDPGHYAFILQRCGKLTRTRPASKPKNAPPPPTPNVTSSAQNSTSAHAAPATIRRADQ